MSQAGGFLIAAAQVGLEAVMLKPKRGIFAADQNLCRFPQDPNRFLQDPIIAQATIEETEHDEMEMTEHPVEVGSSIIDHAYKRPSEVIVRYGFSNSPSNPGLLQGFVAGLAQTANIPQSIMAGNAQSQISALYDRLLALQVNRVLFTLYTGKRKHVNMMIKALTAPTNMQTENTLNITIHCRQVLFARTKVVTLGQTSASVQSSPEQTAPVTDRGDVSMTDAPAVQSQINTSTGQVSGVSDTLNSALTTAGTDISTTVQTAVGQLQSTAEQAVKQLPGVMQEFAAATEGAAATLSGGIAGVSSTLPAVISSVTAELQSAVASIGNPFQIPLINGPQTFSITLGPQVAP